MDNFQNQKKMKLLFFIISCLIITQFLIASPDYIPDTPAEEYVIKQVTAGEIVNLKKQFPHKEDQILDSDFLVKLLADNLNGVKVHPNGISIRNAIFIKSINLKNTEIPHEISFDSCIFCSTVKFSKRIIFNKGLKFRNTLFKQLSLEEVKIKGDFSFFDVELLNLSFPLMDIDGNFLLSNVTIWETARFDSIKVKGAATLKHLVFNRFNTNVTFIGLDIAGDFKVDSLTFQGVNFQSIKVGNNAFFNNTVFNGKVSFFDADISGDFVVIFDTFKDTVYFNRIKAGGEAFFYETTFKEIVNFLGADIAGDFEVISDNFQEFQEVNFRGIKVGKNFFFRNSVFEGKVNLVSADINGDIEFDSIRFNELCNFDFIKVNGNVSFQNVLFKDLVSIKDASFSKIKISGGSIDTCDTWPKLDLSRTEINKELRIENAKIKNMITTSIHVKGPTHLPELCVTETLNLEHSSFQYINLQGFSWPQKEKSYIKLEGMTYQYIAEDDWDSLTKLVSSSKFSRSAYTNLKKFLFNRVKKIAQNKFISK